MTTINQIENVINKAHYFKNAYFFNPPCNANSRRWYEKNHSIPRIEWTEGKDIYTAEFIVSCSCKNVYAYGIYTKNGKKTTLTAIKNSWKRLAEMEEC